MRSSRTRAALFCASSLVGCGGLQAANLFSTEAGADTGTTQASETGATRDAGHGGTDDATPDTGTVTASPDATSGTDAAPPPADAGQVVDTGAPPPTGTPCGPLRCSGATSVCCVTGVTNGGIGGGTIGETCVTDNVSCANMNGAIVTCSPSTGCSGGETCCATYTFQEGTIDLTGVECKAQCGGMTGASGSTPVCDPDGGTCGFGRVCTRVGNTSYGACEP